jgi:uncharacterized protein (TIGR02246 family)
MTDQADESNRHPELLIRSLVGAWNRRDPAGFADHFAPSAEYVTGSGERIAGRDRIAELVRGESGTSEIVVVGPVEVSTSSGSARVQFNWASGEVRHSARQGTILCSLVWTGREWLIDRLTNSEAGQGGSRTRG